MKLTTCSKVAVHSYKHDQSLHRIWKEATVLEDNEDLIIVANRKTKVVEANGRFWYTKEPSVTFFFKKHWYNVIGILKPTGITFYCNISSPVIADDEAVKYIDYDLDVKVMENRYMMLLDQNEYLKHARVMKYPKELCTILEEETAFLQTQIQEKAYPFNQKDIEQWYQKYQSL